MILFVLLQSPWLVVFKFGICHQNSHMLEWCHPAANRTQDPSMAAAKSWTSTAWAGDVRVEFQQAPRIGNNRFQRPMDRGTWTE